ncbi:MAG: hypothetical protein K2N70_07775 [Helicobacter sp.]|nr:hypothetical protein [Helicobacter sp.]
MGRQESLIAALVTLARNDIGILQKIPLSVIARALPEAINHGILCMLIATLVTLARNDKWLESCEFLS